MRKLAFLFLILLIPLTHYFMSKREAHEIEVEIKQQQIFFMLPKETWSDDLDSWSLQFNHDQSIHVIQLNLKTEPITLSYSKANTSIHLHDIIKDKQYQIQDHQIKSRTTPNNAIISFPLGDIKEQKTLQYSSILKFNNGDFSKYSQTLALQK